MEQGTTKQFKDLYTLDKKGKIRIFKIRVVHSGDISEIISETGLRDGSLTDNITVIKQGKQKRSISEQAEFQAQSDWNSKLDEGYKSYSQLYAKYKSIDTDREENLPSLKANHTPETIDVEELFILLKITHNTNSNWRPLPMLAEKWKPNKKKVVYPAITQPKLNGVRCLTSYDPDLQEVIQDSRGGKEYIIPYMRDLLRPLFLLNQDLVLDGELYVHGKSLQSISGAVREKVVTVTWIEYHIYDIVSKDPQYSRLNKLRNIIELNYSGNPYIKLVDSVQVNSEEEVNQLHDNFVASGYEGAIVRQFNGKYLPSFRDVCLLKVKEFEDEEFEILGCEVSEGKTVGESFVFVLKNNTDDQEFKARPTGTEEEKVQFWKDIETLKGKKATVRFQERTEGGLPHQAHVRKDSLIVRDYE